MTGPDGIWEEQGEQADRVGCGWELSLGSWVLGPMVSLSFVIITTLAPYKHPIYLDNSTFVLSEFVPWVSDCSLFRVWGVHITLLFYLEVQYLFIRLNLYFLSYSASSHFTYLELRNKQV